MHDDSMPLWAWILFYVLVFIMLLIDLKSFGKKGQHEVKVSEALKMTAVWIGVSLLFCGGIYLFYPGDSHEKASSANTSMRCSSGVSSAPWYSEASLSSRVQR